MRGRSNHWLAISSTTGPSTTNRSDDGPSSIEGRVHQGTYLGDQTEFRIETDVAGEVVTRRQNAAGMADLSGVGPGDAVVIRWEDTANLILVA